jgi:hypothetical protein
LRRGSPSALSLDRYGHPFVQLAASSSSSARAAEIALQQEPEPGVANFNLTRWNRPTEPWTSRQVAMTNPAGPDRALLLATYQVERAADTTYIQRNLTVVSLALVYMGAVSALVSGASHVPIVLLLGCRFQRWAC